MSNRQIVNALASIAFLILITCMDIVSW